METAIKISVLKLVPMKYCCRVLFLGCECEKGPAGYEVCEAKSKKDSKSSIKYTYACIYQKIRMHFCKQQQTSIQGMAPAEPKKIGNCKSEFRRFEKKSEIEIANREIFKIWK
jgi:hypothetical protein